MALPEILKHIYNNATDEVIRRGKKIFHTSGVQLIENDPISEQAVFRVRNDVYNNYYKVTIEKYLQPKAMVVRCTCPYNMGAVCRHEAAALFQLNDLIQSGFFEHAHIDYNQTHTVVRMRQISLSFLKLFSSENIVSIAEEWAFGGRVSILDAKDDTVRGEVRDDDGKKFNVVVKQNEERYFDTSCQCNEKQHPLCIHKVSLFLNILNVHGAHYFSSLRNWDDQKEKLLNLYGYSLKDDLTNKFEFVYQDGKPFLRVLDTSIKKLSYQSTFSSFQKPEKETKTTLSDRYRLGVLLSNSSKYFPSTAIELIAGDADANGENLEKNLEKLNLNNYIPANHLDEREKLLVTSIRKLSPEDLVKWLKKNSPFGDFLDSIDKDLRNNPDAELQNQVWDFYLPRYHRLLEQYKDYPFVYFLPEGKSFKLSNLEKLKFSVDNFLPHIYITKGAKNIKIELQLSIGGNIYYAHELTLLNSSLARIGNTLHVAHDADTINIVGYFNGATEKEISFEDWNEYLVSEIMPLSSKASIEFDDNLQQTVTSDEPEYRLYMSESDKLLAFRPVFAYSGVEKQWLDNSSAITADNGKVIVHERNEASEQTLLTLLRHIHPDMQESRKLKSFLMPAKDVLKGNWYFNFLQKMQELNVAIIGYNSLKQLRINPNKPITSLQVSSGIDWFDADVDVAFGEEHVNIATIKKALAKQQNYVVLQDGSKGLLPEEWMDKYGLLMKVGTLKDNKLHLKNFHFTALEGLEDEFQPNPVLLELAEKRKRLLNFDYESSPEADIPDNVNATLRPYQESGFQWMQFLNETGWGGILADDMGLGKTLQTLSFLQYYQNNHPDAKFLIVCPTSLMYNWEGEIRKFTADLTYISHHGTKRASNIEAFKPYNAIITSYGTLRSDAKMLSNINFDYVVMDESQAIKNPVSQVAKAALILNAKNRLALSGTPIQNNTFDLFAQMNFLNPGMLGSMEFFRNEFANPIDKNMEDEPKKQLRKMVFPFLLRRTKEQVASDLPEKTETVLFCEMGSKQRKLYDAYRSEFRSKILGEIEERGIERSQMSILHGLMKLRQICDSPAILNEKDGKYDNNSIKIDELVRELSENTTNHKALVFSQFLGMLGLIRAELEKLNIPYEYFDGSTSTSDREKAITNFQNDGQSRVFLISLKAGGVGLNLTAADYVYIVDPWWNPAVEQQAIDRTHRIGQTKRIFAYRMICKDTIEEKIMLLQERKLNLVRELIADDSGFLKKLTKDDIAYLLS